jgi:hypothetical protein
MGACPIVGREEHVSLLLMSRLIGEQISPKKPLKP